MWLPEHDPDRTRHAEALARALPMAGNDRNHRAASVLVAEINGVPALDAPVRPYLEAAGFVATTQGLQLRVTPADDTTRTTRPARWTTHAPIEDLPAVADENLAPIRWPGRASNRQR